MSWNAYVQCFLNFVPLCTHASSVVWTTCSPDMRRHMASCLAVRVWCCRYREGSHREQRHRSTYVFCCQSLLELTVFILLTVMIFSACMFILGYAMTWAPGIWILIGETFPTRTRAKQGALATASNWLWNFLLAFFTPFIVSAIDFRYGFVFACVLHSIPCFLHPLTFCFLSV